MEENYLEKAIEIKKWIENNKEKLPPSKSSKESKEKELAKNLNYIRKKLIKPYQKLKKDKDIKNFEEKHPDIYEIVKVVQSIDALCITQTMDKQEQEKISNNKEIEKELEKVEVENNKEKLEIEFDKENKKQYNLVSLIKKDIELKNTIKKANKLKKKYEEE